MTWKITGEWDKEYLLARIVDIIHGYPQYKLEFWGRGFQILWNWNGIPYNNRDNWRSIAEFNTQLPAMKLALDTLINHMKECGITAE